MLTKLKDILRTAPADYQVEQLFYTACNRIKAAAEDFASTSILGVPSAEKLGQLARTLIVAITDAERIADTARALHALRNELAAAQQQQTAEQTEQEIANAF